ncbi:MAG: hypothetical protein AAF581_16885 [Planctomycetota bacterium]
MKRILVLSFLLCAFGATQTAQGQGAIADMGATWEWTGTVGNGNFDAGSGDQLFRQWWWQQGAGGGATTAPLIMSFPTTQTYVGNTATISWNGAAWQRQLLVTITGGAGTASVLQEMTITNSSGSSSNVRLFAYVDNDIAGSSNDSAAMVNNDPFHVRASDGAPYSDFLGVAADHYVVAAYNTVPAMIESGNNLPNTGYPFGPGDFTAAMQWDRVIADGQSATVYAVFTYGEAAAPPVVMPPTDTFIRGDCNGDMSTNLVDAVFLLGFLFPLGTPNVIDCDDSCDANDDGSLNLTDAIGILNALFGNPTIPLPGPLTCDGDPTMDTLTCAIPTC